MLPCGDIEGVALARRNRHLNGKGPAMPALSSDWWPIPDSSRTSHWNHV